MMTEQRNEYDVTGTIRVTDPTAVANEVLRIFHSRYPRADADPIRQAFAYFQRIYRGEHPDFLACDTLYHDIQHSLDVALTQTRLMDGYEQETDNAGLFGIKRFTLGIIAALFHDAGYIRRRDELQVKNGAELTQQHVTRGIKLLSDYLGNLEMAEHIELATHLLLHTGYEHPLDPLQPSAPHDKILARMLGTADLITQMADRCYLEKCRDRLYPEFVAAGLAGDGTPYPTPSDFLRQTPNFFQTMHTRLEGELDGVYRYAEIHFAGTNHYIDSVKQNLRYLDQMITDDDYTYLRRVPPVTLV